MAVAKSNTFTGSDSPITTMDSRPVPDPTVLTTQQLAVAIDNVTTLFDTKIEAMNTAVELLQSLANRSPTIGELSEKFTEKFHLSEQRFLDRDKRMEEVIKGINDRFESIAEISKERFIRIDQSFIERDKRTDQLTLASSTAIAAALQAQKEAAGETQKSSAAAIAKSETSTSESIKQLQTLFQTSISGLSTQILDVKSRLDKGEGGHTGAREMIADYRYDRGDQRAVATDNRGMVFGGVGMVVGIIGMFVAMAAIAVHLIK